MLPTSESTPMTSGSGPARSLGLNGPRRSPDRLHRDRLGDLDALAGALRGSSLRQRHCGMTAGSTRDRINGRPRWPGARRPRSGVAAGSRPGLAGRSDPARGRSSRPPIRARVMSPVRVCWSGHAPPRRHGPVGGWWSVTRPVRRKPPHSRHLRTAVRFRAWTSFAGSPVPAARHVSTSPRSAPPRAGPAARSVGAPSTFASARRAGTSVAVSRKLATPDRTPSRRTTRSSTRCRPTRDSSGAMPTAATSTEAPWNGAHAAPSDAVAKTTLNARHQITTLPTASMSTPAGTS